MPSRPQCPSRHAVFPLLSELKTTVPCYKQLINERQVYTELRVRRTAPNLFLFIFLLGSETASVFPFSASMTRGHCRRRKDRGKLIRPAGTHTCTHARTRIPANKRHAVCKHVTHVHTIPHTRGPRQPTRQATATAATCYLDVENVLCSLVTRSPGIRLRQRVGRQAMKLVSHFFFLS